MSEVIRKVTNFIYNTKSKRKKFVFSYPDEKIILCDAAKGVKLKNDKVPEYGKEWVIAKRCALLISEKQIIAGNWNINISDIKEAEVIKFGTIYGKGMVLKINTNNNEYYQFGLQYNKVLEEQNIITINIKKQELKLSIFSLLIRLLALGFLLYYIITKFIFK
ncbi:MAG: hypothetical protein A2015_01550 [Spirochaetes bacterium GWF1_31_7]|nr:MAG: hypothetical protein A2015_01550 [Spirochaetes bacterium GWF1_31_7]OHD52682.1 MAG: hypothetical protein A2Y29_04820 [Spirochaetes bacterium GWE2_31_10]HBD94751.1 hypothetical protein [Spirochaetia bacterium]HBI39079.1 hypothetical protein [Spirochaetia bacterium]